MLLPKRIPFRPASPRIFSFRVLLVGIGLCALCSAALAHSFERSFASARYAERIDEQGIHVLVVVELPSLDVLGDFRRFLRDHPDASDEENTERFRRAQLDLIADSFTLKIAGSASEEAWQPVENPANGLGDSDFFVYMLEKRLPTPKARSVEVEVINALQPAKVVFMSSRAESSGAWKVDEDSSRTLLAEGLDGEVIGPDVAEEAMDKWSTDEAMRHVRVLFRRGD